MLRPQEYPPSEAHDNLAEREEGNGGGKHQGIDLAEAATRRNRNIRFFLGAFASGIKILCL
jgi:hypothetical protein